MVNAYRRNSLFSDDVQALTVPVHREVDEHMVPNSDKGTMEIRIGWNRQSAHCVALPMRGFRVHL